MEVWVFIVAFNLACLCAGLLLAVRAQGEIRRLNDINLDLRASLYRHQRAVPGQPARDRVIRDAPGDGLREALIAMRVPLTAVTGFADLMAVNARGGSTPDPLSPYQARAVDQIRDSAARILAMLDRRLAKTQIPTDLPMLTLQRIDPQIGVRRACVAVRDRAAALSVVVHAPAATAGLGAIADPHGLDRILVDLLGRAVECAGPGGSVLVELRQSRQGVAIAIHHTGLQVADSPLQTDVGLDDALFEVGRMAEAMGGRLAISGDALHGATLCLHLPGAEAADVMASPVPRLNLLAGAATTATLLYIDDQPSNAMLMRRVIAALGPMRLHVATSVTEGERLAHALKPDVVLASADMADMDICDLTRRLCAEPSSHPAPVIALSQRGGVADVRRARRAGIQSWLSLPLDLSGLTQALGAALSSIPAAQPRIDRAA